MWLPVPDDQQQRPLQVGGRTRDRVAPLRRWRDTTLELNAEAPEHTVMAHRAAKMWQASDADGNAWSTSPSGSGYVLHDRDKAAAGT